MKPEWESRTLGDICEFVRGPFGGSLKKSIFKSEGFAVYEQQHAINNQFNSIRYFIDENKFSEMRRFELCPGDLIMSCSGTMGKVAIVPEAIQRGIINQALLKLTPSEELSVEFLRLWMLSPLFQEQLGKRSKGVAIKNVASVKVLKEISIDLPLLPVQKRIVAIIDEAFAGIDTAIANTEKNLANARELFESYLNSVFTKQCEGWSSYKLINLTTKIGSGATPKGGRKSYKTEGISLIRSLNVYDRRFTNRKLAFIDDEQAAKLLNVVVEERDVFFNITGASVARCCVAPKEYLPARVNQHVSILRPKSEELDTDFLCYLMTSRIYKDQLLGIGDEGGSTRQAITKSQLQDFKIAIPNNLSEQKSIVQQLESLELEILRLESMYKQKQVSLTELKQSLLQKAFSGELITETDKIMDEAVA